MNIYTNKFACYSDRSAVEVRNVSSAKQNLTEKNTVITRFELDTRNDYPCSFDIQHVKTVFMIFLMFVTSVTSFAQNIMQINNSLGVINDTVSIELSIVNNQEFISFQCDILLPDGFNYIPGSVSLTSRSVDHVVNVTNIENNTIRILSYSLNNTAFLLDSGTVAKLNLTTPSSAGHYAVGINNGIIGNSESVNILDSVIGGEINLSTIGISENKFLKNKIICYPNPFSGNLSINIDADKSQLVQQYVFDIYGRLLSNHKLQISNDGINTISFTKHELLGNKPSSGTYLLYYRFLDEKKSYSVIKEIQYNK